MKDQEKAGLVVVGRVNGENGGKSGDVDAKTGLVRERTLAKMAKNGVCCAAAKIAKKKVMSDEV